MTSSFWHTTGFPRAARIATSAETELWVADDDDEVVAVKRPRAGASPGAAQRLRNEAEALQGLLHPALVRLLRVGDAAGIPYLVLEYLSGEDALSLLRLTQAARRAVPVEMAARIVADASAGVGALLDGKGWIHGDLAPANLFVEYGGRSVVLDFGASRPAGAASRSIAARRVYLAPEVRGGVPADRTSDVFSLGASLYHLLSGKTFAAASSGSGRRGRAPSRADVTGEAMERVVAAATARHPSDRPGSAHELARLLEPLAASPGDLSAWIARVVPPQRRAARCDPHLDDVTSSRGGKPGRSRRRASPRSRPT